MTYDKPIVITGAGGFLGGWVTEGLHLLGYEVHAGVRRWGSAARIGRFPIRVVQCDVLDPDQLRRATESAGAIVHCAMGPGEQMSRGVANVLQAARANGVERVVHLSSAAVYGAAEGDIDESARFDGIDPYSAAKIEAERVCRESGGDVGVTVLRPSIIYGPYGKSWVARPAARLLAGTWGTLGRDGEGLCNPIYAGDLVRAILSSITAGQPGYAVYNVNGPEVVTWNEYFRRLGVALGMTAIPELSVRRVRAKARVLEPARALAKMALNRLNPAIRWVAGRQGTGKLAMRKAEAAFQATPALGELQLYARRAHYRSERIGDVLGFMPRTTLDEGLGHSAAWVLHARG